ncbi:MAG: DNA primase [Solirubrobacterales bacterium]|nr:DNA primase [Solirubrobacterales bacterium]
MRDAVDFVELVGDRTELRKAGVRRYVGLCPFHDERSPSFGIDPVEKLYHCFGCGEGGDVFKFVMETESLDFGAALEALADRSGVELERETEDPRSAERRTRRERLLALLERTAAFYVRVLWEAEEAATARENLKARGLEEPALRQFRVGYAPSGWDRVLHASRRAGYSEEELRAAGLVTRSKEGRMYDAFRGRITFPLTDRRGRVLGFGARAMRDNQGPKYVNSRDGEIYRKGRQLFAVDLARVDATRVGSVVLAEGYTDVIALHQAGMRHAVGLMGTALTEDQAVELGQLARTVLLCLDADAAGQAAMVRAAGLVAARGNELRVVPLPAGADPADIVSSDGGGEAMRTLLDQAMPFARFQVERALGRAQIHTAEGRDATLAEVADIVGPMPQSVLREELVQLTAGRLRLSEALTATVLGMRGTAQANGVRVESRPSLDRLDRTERSFLALCLAMPDDGARRLAGMDLEALFESLLTRRAAAFVRDHAASPASALPDDDPELAGLIAELVLRADEIEPSGATLDVEALQLELARLDRRIEAARAEGGAVTALAGERQRVRDEIRHKLH